MGYNYKCINPSQSQWFVSLDEFLVCCCVLIARLMCYLFKPVNQSVSQSAFTVTPQNVVVMTNESSVIFNCTTVSTTVDWLYYEANNSRRSSCYIYKTSASPGSYCTDISRFNVNVNLRSFDLVITRPQASDAGTYVCAESGGQKAAAILGVIGMSEKLLSSFFTSAVRYSERSSLPLPFLLPPFRSRPRKYSLVSGKRCKLPQRALDPGPSENRILLLLLLLMKFI